MFKPGAKPGAYGYEPTWEHSGPMYNKSTKLWHREREERIYEQMFGKEIPLWWPEHPGTGNKISHFLRTVYEKWGSDMKGPPTDVHGFYYELDFVGPSTV